MKIKADFKQEGRKLKQIDYTADLVVVGGGLSGVSAAITAARQGLKTILVQDRSVLGGNASSEVRLWILGATSHMGNNNRWSREGGIVDEILVENTFRNAEGNPVILDMILLDKVKQEPNITLLLNTAVYALDKRDADTIDALYGFCSLNSTNYYLKAPLFCDASGDGIVGFLSGAAFRMGAESAEEFGELMAPEKDYGELLGHSLYFYSKDVGKPVPFIPPSFAMDVTKEIPRFHSFNAQEFGCKLWWVEHGGRLDTVYDSETIKWDLWRIVYGIWDYVKNSGKFPEAENLTLEWVGMIPGKRESRRFEGDYILTQQDLVLQRQYTDAVAYGGWSIDLHPADGVFSAKDPCNQWHSKGIFQIPYRCLYSRNIRNLFLAGRIISVSHVAFGATRVMATSAFVGQAVGVAAALCKQDGLEPRALGAPGKVATLQQELARIGHYIPHVDGRHPLDLVQEATIRASSTLAFQGFDAIDVKWKTLQISAAQLLPLPAGPCPSFRVKVRAVEPTTLSVELRTSSRPGNFTPDTLLDKQQVVLQVGEQELRIDFAVSLAEEAYVFVIFRENGQVALPYTEQRITGLVSVFNGINKAVSNYGKQVPPEGMGVDAFEFWCPQRRPEGQNICLRLDRPVGIFSTAYLANGVDRPFTSSNAWVAAPDDQRPELTLSWKEEKQVSRIDLFFDTDFDHPMESVLMTHPERRMPFCVQDYEVLDDQGRILYRQTGNFRTWNSIRLDAPVFTRSVVIRLSHPSDRVPASLFALRCYAAY